MQPGNKVILNTGILYLKMAISILVGLLSTRLVLEALGVEDYGLYNLLAGIVTMLMFLNVSLAASTQRFLSYSLGDNNEEHLGKVFYYSVVLHVVIGVCVVLLIETIGVYSIKHFLSINPDRVRDALVILHLLSCSVFFAILAVPYIAILISRENMLLLSIFEIIEALLKLIGAIWLLSYHGDRLVLYASVIAAVMVVSLFLKIIVCYLKYKETHIKFKMINDHVLLRSMTSFAGWYTFAAVGSIGRIQGIPVLLNIFFGVVVNAAFGIANQVNGLMQFFATAILQSIRPQVVKSEGANDRRRAQKLSLIACRYMYFLCAVFSIPLILEMPYVLNLWLNNPPEYTAGFCQLVLFATMLFMITCGLSTAIDATGKIKWMYITMGILHFLNLPIGYLLLKMGMSAYSVLWIVIGEEFVSLWFRVYLAHRIVGISMSGFVRHVITPITLITVTTFIVGIAITSIANVSFLRLVATSVLCGSTFLIMTWRLGIEGEEKERIQQLAGSMCVKFKQIFK